ncbi:signal transduction histidine kinase [Hyphomicrobium denitrificans ATCC 51888]|uniref:Blue-light-activated histidine kinase n=1 Tax=Hyphomicrobium denitrificans (strain ATCC 51888 / DSM 1869 / NCIMB 11706 / TK 0415) TaxID=582899 RepID=D8JX40_HYPDA|nr:response regulator [Hyphomicrobium denitrificans]ADJ23176.1 signal transduction histidine kinase [Hyphomicrobium denitrificans ATCC 51888]
MASTIFDETVNILLVDDQPGKLLAYEAILDGVNANLIKATTAEEALTVLLKTDIAVILMDVCMPDLDGFELAEMIRNHPRHEKTAVIFISAVRLETDDLLKGYRTGAVDYVPVPVVPEILKAKVQIFVELHRKSRQLDVLNADLEERVKQRTEQLVQSHAMLQQSEERLRLASEAARLGTFEYDQAEQDLQWSQNIADVLHVAVPEHQRFDDFIDLVHSDDREAVRSYFRAANFAETTAELEFRIIGARGDTWVLTRARAFLTAGTSATRVIGTLLDITERKSADSHQQLLMAELDHRVKNILANVAAIARLSSSNATSIDTFASALDGRIHAMSAAHDLLRQSSWTGVDLHKLVAGALEPFKSRTDNDIVIEGERVRLTSKFAQSMALVLHELATNAVKHGALSTSGGKVSVGWSRVPTPDGEKIKFAWTERGGPPCAKPIRKGFGLTVIRSASSECGGQANMDLSTEGFEFSFEGDLSARTQMVSQRHVSIIPRAVPAATVTPPDAPGCKILLIEDEALIAMQLKLDLEEDGHTVIGPIAQLSEALRTAAESEFDIALIDINLGADNSAPVAEILDRRNVPFAFTTGYNDLIFMPPLLRNYPHLTKPYSLVDVKDLVAKLQRQSAERAERTRDDANQVA